MPDPRVPPIVRRLGLVSFFTDSASEMIHPLLLAEHAPKEARGRAFAAMHALTGLAVLPANLAFGALNRVKPALAFGTSAVIAGVAALALTLSVRDTRST